MWFERFIYCFNQACPKVSKNIKEKQPENARWITSELKQFQLEVENWYYLSRNFPLFREVFKLKKKEYEKKLKITVSEYYSKIIEKSPSISTGVWQAVNTRLGKSIKERSIQSIDLDGTTVTGPELVQEFGKYFANVAEAALNKHFDDQLSSKCTTSKMATSTMFCMPTTTEEIAEIIMQLANKKTSGFDEVSVQVLKAVYDVCSVQLSLLINFMLCEGVFPDILKLGRVVPIYKKGDPANMENYRPVCMLSIFSKIVEKAVLKRIVSYLNKHKLISKSQHGFRENHSTETATLQFFMFVNKEIDNGKYVAAIFFDFSKAFDSVYICFILEKLAALGLRGNILKFIKSYLTNRKITVKIGGRSSDEFNVECGVPQGSILGPILFLLFINDLPDYLVDGLVINFADDTSVAISGKSLEELRILISNINDKMAEWCYKNRIILNTEKTKLIIFNHKLNNTESLFFQSNASTVFLGLRVDNDLDWHGHVNYVCRELNKSFYAILNLKEILSVDALINVYYGTVYSRLAYCTPVWGGSGSSNRALIQQKRILRLILNLKPRQSCKEYFRKYSILTFTCIYIYKCIIYVAQHLDSFIKNNALHSYSTRGGDLIALPQHRTTKFEKSAYYRCTLLYNKLPDALRNLTIKRMKKKLKAILVKKGYYTIEEFLSDDAFDMNTL